MATKKELKEAYRQMKPDMGVFWIKSVTEDKYQLFAVPDINSRINRVRFQLELGSHPNKELQNDWNARGGENFIFETLDQLQYSKDETKTDYSDELELLRMEREEKLSRKGFKPYN